jgi:transketolase
MQMIFSDGTECEMTSIEDIVAVQRIRKEVFLTAYAGGSAHLASAYSIVEMLYALYCKNVLRYDSANPDWVDRDILILSKGHGVLALYVMLRKCRFITEDTLKSYLYPGSILGGEANPLEIPGVEALTGSLGHGLSYGIGKALAYKIDARSNKVYVIVGDGEAQEGCIWEAAMFAAAKKLDNLIVIFDQNKMQKMGALGTVMGYDDWYDKWFAFGWDAIRANGHDSEEIADMLKSAKANGKPLVIIAETVKGKGVSIMENNPVWHYKMPNKKEMRTFVNELNITEEELENAAGISERHI